MESNCSPCGALPRRSARLERQDQTAIPFHHLSVSNLPPTDRELSDIQTTILPALDQDILAVDSDAAVTTAPLALESLEQERDALKNMKQNYENIISTRRRIPQRSVFDWPSRTIWQLSQVCQTWRNLAFSLHSCWSSIALKFPLLRSASERDVELLAFVLERSHQHALDIIFIRNSVEDLPFLRRMREKVFAESHRWRTARVIDYHKVRPDLLYAPLRGRLPQLELLEFDSVGTMDSDIISAFKDCPRLVTVGLTGVDPRIVELPMKQITCLHLSYHRRQGADYFGAYVDLIGQCPLLESLRVDSASELARDPLLQSLTLPCLRDLNALYPYLLDSLTLPRLEVAALDASCSLPHPDTLYSFYCLIRRSDCASNLTELRIIQVPLTLHRSEPHLLLSVLSQTTELATLHLCTSGLDSQHLPDEWSKTQIIEVMKALAVVPGHCVAFLPRLASLDIRKADHDADCIPYLEPHNDFVAMLKARHAGDEDGLSKLEEFRFSLCAELHVMTGRSENDFPIFNDYEISVLRGLTEDGMSLDISYHWGTSGTCFRCMF
ncbi:hypothetical protein BDZ89DRAFT_1062144 [Hymenopellis radicata]|nr:hypothetical protein BDZ89DRAFT_1062144 [Hymenopellis radicata]